MGNTITKFTGHTVVVCILRLKMDVFVLFMFPCLTLGKIQSLVLYALYIKFYCIESVRQENLLYPMLRFLFLDEVSKKKAIKIVLDKNI